VLDEIARCKIREETQQELVCYVLNERYANNLPTVLITNLDKKELVKWLGFAAKDRLNECGMVIELNCESYRIKKRREIFSGG
jgi:DNA replication protein DnaC